MALMKWDDSYSVRVAAIDEQHKKLFLMVNELHQAMSQGKGREILGQTLDGLIAYAGTHFATEENLMQTTGFPEYRGHKREHDEFVEKVTSLQQQFSANQYSLSIQTMQFLKEWLTRHILGTDQNYAAHFRSQGVK